MAARTLFRVAVCVALTLSLTACQGESTPLVSTAEVAPAEVTETVSAPGSVTGAAREEASAEVAGRIAELGVQSGDMVAAGEVMARLESPQLDAALEETDEALAALEAAADVSPDADLSVDPLPVPANPAEGAVAELDANVRPQLEAARAALRNAPEVPEELAEALPEDTRLPSGGAQEANAALDALESTYQGVREALLAAGEAARAQQRELSAQVTSTVAEAERALEAALADVSEQATEAQRTQLDATRAQVQEQRESLLVEAPITGVVEVSRGEPGLSELETLAAGGLAGIGESVAPGELEEHAGASEEPVPASGLAEGSPVVPGQPLFVVHDLSEWYVDAEVDEVDAPAVTEGQRALVLIDAFPGQEFEGVVESMALSAERGLTGGVAFNTRVRLLSPPEDPSPRLGMTASVEIVTSTVEADLAIPTRAVVRRDVGTAVYVVREDVAVLVAVELLAQGDDVAAVQGDLAAGEQVIVAGYEALADGSRVRTE